MNPYAFRRWNLKRGPEVPSDIEIADSSGNSQADTTRHDASDVLPPRPAAASDAIETALTVALEGATKAGRWDVVAQLAKELEARRLARAVNVVAFPTRERR